MSNDREIPQHVTLALVQMSCVKSKSQNIEKALEKIADAAKRGANIVCLQELFAGTYPCQSEDHDRFAEAEPIPGPTSEALSRAARQHGVVVIGSLFERRTAGLYHNTAIVFDSDTIPRSKRAQTDSRFPRQSAVHVRHEGRPLFVPAYHEFNGRVQQRDHYVGIFFPRDPEDVLHPFVLQALDK